MQDYGYQVVDAIVAHFDTQNEKFPVATASRSEMDILFQQDAPEHPSNATEVLHFVLENVMTKSNIVTHPRSYSFVPGPSNYISAMSDTLATGFNIFSGGWAASPAAAELEIVTMNWLLKLFGLPIKKGGGIFTSGGSMANLTALVTARNIKCGQDFSKAVIYLSDQAHSSNIKAIHILGFKKEQIRMIPTDMEFKFSVNKLKNAIAKDKLEGLQPFCLIASSGTTNTGTVDSLNELAAICKKEKLWFHIDAAYGGAAILAKNGKKLLQGIEKADSITVDPHKWFFQPYEIGCLLVRNHKWLSGTFTEKPEYLRDIEGNESEINFYDHGIELTRRFRALKFYMSIKTFGLKAFRKAIDYNIYLAEQLEDFLRKSDKWEVVSPANLAIINFRYNPIAENWSEKQLDKINQKISKKVVASREALLVTTILNRQVVLRMCLINPRTTMNDIKSTILLCEKFAAE
ncbi:MAG: decarboxylase [Flavobacteriaceae bacterium CG_4_8_14_3_um_filter_34_10]|nr:aspartate aminotransferase family protein [Flavobacteriia bacterium]OIP50936.1 MAG: decarboxylase [Flavobacteriaceae bacterium CG2_30_34_30]PIV48685.1 MAG: decarboxylase [Flavobacteriaceae bacterium CG02_land_8_20_14_3_00_34_13]PIX09077.1 MAG: decarboxylase [Flavobacteriaceae bacterium CG_4_8_14_3_um_filter_34_10]PIZ07111.1 MAG: decarboxylase [Flavobacteriaceae bacterium CG_4_10_14_0_8_um_filter_34_31]